jgi:hypothetical protein
MLKLYPGSDHIFLRDGQDFKFDLELATEEEPESELLRASDRIYKTLLEAMNPLGLQGDHLSTAGSYQTNYWGLTTAKRCNRSSLPSRAASPCRSRPWPAIPTSKGLGWWPVQVSRAPETNRSTLYTKNIEV